MVVLPLLRPQATLQRVSLSKRIDNLPRGIGTYDYHFCMNKVEIPVTA